MTANDITCTVCGVTFPFTEEEQEFYQSKGFQPPRKCKPCRDEAKQSRGGGGGGGYGGGSRGGFGGGGGGGGRSFDRPARPMYDAVCSACGVNTQVPFQPNGSKPVYCRECFQNTASY